VPGNFFRRSTEHKQRVKMKQGFLVLVTKKRNLEWTVHPSGAAQSTFKITLFFKNIFKKEFKRAKTVVTTVLTSMSRVPNEPRIFLNTDGTVCWFVCDRTVRWYVATKISKSGEWLQFHRKLVQYKINFSCFLNTAKCNVLSKFIKAGVPVQNVVESLCPSCTACSIWKCEASIISSSLQGTRR